MRMPLLVSSFVATLLASTTYAADAPKGGDDKEDSAAKEDESTEPEEGPAPQKEIKVGGEVAGNAVGGATGFVFKQGFYTQSDLGAFFRFGGFTNAKDG